MENNFNGIRKFNLWDDTVFQSGIKRDVYLNKINHFIDTKLVKVLVGQRRCGKSFLLKQIAMQLIEKNGIDTENILYINLEFLEFDFLNTYSDLETLYKYYKEIIRPKGKVYLFIDEIQNIEDWEKFVNARAQNFVEETELFITGSNSTLLSGELATLLSGRYVEFFISSFSYLEHLKALNKNNSRQEFINYLNGGALPELYNIKNFESQKQYVSSVKDTILLRDIANRKTIRDIKLLDDLFIYLVNNASNLFSISNLINFFKSKKRTVSYETISNYIAYLEEAFLVHKCERYNIKGKETIGGTAKYYVNDLAFKNLLFSGFGYGIGYLLENNIYLELKRAGFAVYTGNWAEKEVDFVAQKEDRIIYIQCSYSLESKTTLEREYNALKVINDNYEKWIVSLDEIQIPILQGIKHIQAWKIVENGYL